MVEEALTEASKVLVKNGLITLVLDELYASVSASKANFLAVPAGLGPLASKLFLLYRSITILVRRRTTHSLSILS